MKIKIQKNIDLNELFYILEDLKKSTNDFNQKLYYNNIFNILNDFNISDEILDINDTLIKNFCVLNISNNIDENKHEIYIYEKIYIIENIKDHDGTAGAEGPPCTLTLKKTTGKIFYKNIIFCPSLKCYSIFNNIINKTYNRNNINFFNIKFSQVVNNLKLNINNSIGYNNNSLILDYITIFNKLELFDFNKYSNSFILNDKMKFIYNNYGFKSDFNNKTSLLINEKFNLTYYEMINIKIQLRDADYLYIINKYFNTSEIKIFNKNYKFIKNIKKILNDVQYKKMVLLYNKEIKNNKLIENNDCEHINLVNNKNYETIINFYISDKFDKKFLHKHINLFSCIKCMLPLICPHIIYKYYYKNHNLINFIHHDNTSSLDVFCKICGEKLWTTELFNKHSDFNTQNNFDSELFISDNIDFWIYKILYFYILSKKDFIQIKKKMNDNSILSFIKMHVLSFIEYNFDIINKSVVLSFQQKFQQKHLISYVFVLCSLIILAMKNPTFIYIYNKKVLNLKNILSKIILEIKNSNISFKNIHDNTISKIISNTYNELVNNLPLFTELHQLNVNLFKYNDIFKLPFYTYIFLINHIYFGSNFDIEYILNTSMSDININYNNIFIPNLSFLLKKGGNKPKNIPTLKNKFDMSDNIIKIFTDFCNSDFIYYKLKNNKNYLELIQNIKLLNFNLKKPYINYLHDFYNFNNFDNFELLSNQSYIFNSDFFKFNKIPVFVKKSFKFNKQNFNIISNNDFYFKQLKLIEELINKKIIIININNMINIISYDLSLNVDYNDSFINNKLLLNVNFNIDLIIVNNDLYNTLLNIKKNTSLKKYYEHIVKLIIDYDFKHSGKAITNDVSIDINNRSNDENFKEPSFNCDPDESVVYDFAHENFDYDIDDDEDNNNKDF